MGTMGYSISSSLPFRTPFTYNHSPYGLKCHTMAKHYSSRHLSEVQDPIRIRIHHRDARELF